MQILLTRAQDDAARTAEVLTGLGHEVVFSPVIDIVPSGATWPRGVIDALIATSARAFQCLNLAPAWPLPEVRRLLPLFLVGVKTAEAAQKMGFAGRVHAAVDGNALFSLLTDHLRSGVHALYLAGHDRKSFIEDACAAAGVEVHIVETYVAQPRKSLSEEASIGLAINAVDAVLHYSRRSAEIFLELAGAAGLDLSAPMHLAISDDAAAPLKAAALPHVAVAASPDEAALLALLEPARA